MPLARGGAENARTEDHIWTTRSFRVQDVVKVKLKVDRTQGTTSTVFTFTLSSSPQSGYVYDVQMKTGSGSWHSYASGVMTTTFAFQAQAAGTYRFRSRL